MERMHSAREFLKFEFTEFKVNGTIAINPLRWSICWSRSTREGFVVGRVDPVFLLLR